MVVGVQRVHGKTPGTSRREDLHAGKRPEKSYESIAAFYDGKVRDAVLYVFLYRALSSPEEFDTAEQLCKDYFKKYNKNKSYRKELTEMMK